MYWLQRFEPLSILVSRHSVSINVYVYYTKDPPTKKPPKVSVSRVTWGHPRCHTICRE